MSRYNDPPDPISERAAYWFRRTSEAQDAAPVGTVPRMSVTQRRIPRSPDEHRSRIS